ncbi:MAG: hypothetical protein HRU76_00095 [Phycisphaeraceae bacterium]|nr:MAG: hypothetical protein HRU76_00095 [Phycisphaeraceae bacterium]
MDNSTPPAPMKAKPKRKPRRTRRAPTESQLRELLDRLDDAANEVRGWCVSIPLTTGDDDPASILAHAIHAEAADKARRAVGALATTWAALQPVTGWSRTLAKAMDAARPFLSDLFTRAAQAAFRPPTRAARGGLTSLDDESALRTIARMIGRVVDAKAVTFEEAAALVQQRTSKNVSGRKNVSARTIRRWVEAGLLACIDPPDGRVRGRKVVASDVERHAHDIARGRYRRADK